MKTAHTINLMKLGTLLFFCLTGLLQLNAWADNRPTKHPASTAETCRSNDFVEEVDFYGRGPREARERCLDGQDRDWRCRRGDHPYECSRCYEIDYNNYAYEVVASRGYGGHGDRGRGRGDHRRDDRGGEWIRPKNLYMGHWKPYQSWPFCTEQATLNQICQMNGYDGYAGNVTTRHSAQGCTRWNGSGWNKWEHQKTAVDQIQCYRGGGGGGGSYRNPAPAPPPTSQRPTPRPQPPAGAWVDAGNQHFGHWKPQDWPYCPDAQTLKRICKTKGYSDYAGQYRSKNAGHGCTRWNGSGWNARRDQNKGVAQVLCR